MSNITCVRGDRTPDWFTFAVGGLATTLLLLLGVPGICYSSYRLKNRHSKLGPYILFVHFWDILLLLSSFGIFGLPSLLSSPTGVRSFIGPIVHVYIVCHPLLNLALTARIWSIVGLCVERYIAVSKPFYHRTRSHKHDFLILCVCISAGSLCFTLPKFFELKGHPCWDGSQHTSQLGATSLRLNPTYKLIYRTIGDAIVICPLPFLIISFLTAKSWVIRRSSRRKMASRSTASTKSRPSISKADRTSTLLLMMVVMFLTCHSCPTVINMLELIHPSVMMSRWYSRMIEISNVLVTLNCAVNWMLFASGPPKGKWQTEASEKISDSNLSFYKPSTYLHLLDNDQRSQLKEIWPHEKQRTIGKALLEAVTQANPMLKEKMDQLFGDLEEHGTKIGDLLERLFKAALHRQSFDSTSNDMIITSRAHAMHGVAMRNADWIVVKRFLLQHLVEPLEPTHRGLGSSLVTMVVAELKNGFLYGYDRKISAEVHHSSPVFKMSLARERTISMCNLNESLGLPVAHRKLSKIVSLDDRDNSSQKAQKSTNIFYWSVDV